MSGRDPPNQATPQTAEEPRVVTVVPVNLALVRSESDLHRDGYSNSVPPTDDGTVDGAIIEETPRVDDSPQVDLDGSQIVQMLCNSDNGFSLLLDRIKEGVHSCKDAVAFLRKRAAIEEEYAKSMSRLTQGFLSQKLEGKSGTYGDSWRKFVSLHERVADVRRQYGASVGAVADELSALQRNTERSRKEFKDAGLRRWKAVHDSEAALDKAKTRYESCSEEWERALLNREQSQSEVGSGSAGFPLVGGSARRQNAAGMGKGVNLFMHSSANPAKLQKVEDDARARAASANEVYKQQLQTTNSLRSEYLQKQLPDYISSLKEINDVCDKSLQQHLIKYTRETEIALMQEATTLSPLEPSTPAIGLAACIESIDNYHDFAEFFKKSFQQNQNPKIEYEYSPYAMSPQATLLAHPRPSFGVDLNDIHDHDAAGVPLVVTRCIEFVERVGLRTNGIYRLSGVSSQIQRLRGLLDKDVEHVNFEEYAESVHTVTSVLKLYFRELPDTLFPRIMSQEFLNAARIEDTRARLIRTHELVNLLPDRNYATLQALMSHLWNVHLLDSENRMGAQNLAIIWGPTLLDCAAGVSPSASDATPGSPPALDSLQLQSRVVETILVNFNRIFETETTE
ncbi:hypothetical protein HK405_011235 [Cladochytrium tenue]|nr:hypothetical protein HK405_011235 [Cladochytrium tenue]